MNFIVFKLNRSGSSILGKSLSSHSKIKFFTEIFNPKHGENRKEFYKAFKNPSNNFSIGASVNPFKNGYDPSFSLIDFERKKIKIILLYRENTFEQAISSYLAGKYLNSYPGGIGILRKNDVNIIKFLQKKILINQDDLINKYEDLSMKKYYLERFVNKISKGNYYTIRTEDLYYNPELVMNNLLKFINIEKEINFVYPNRNSKIMKNYDNIINYRDLQFKFQNLNESDFSMYPDFE